MASKKSSTLLPLAGMERLLKKAGAERVSEDSKKELGLVLEEIGTELGRKALELSNHASRKTIKKEDISLAFKQFKI